MSCDMPNESAAPGLRELPLFARMRCRSSGVMQKSQKNRRFRAEKVEVRHKHGFTAAGFLFIVAYGTQKIDAPWGGIAMIRSELIQKIADDNPHLYQRDVERIVNTIFDEITGAMSKGDRVELRGFGAFSVKKRDARVGRNPRTGETVHVEEKHVPFFKTGKLLRDRLNGKA